MTFAALAAEPDAAFAELIESKRHPRQQVDCAADENKLTSKGIAGCVVLFPGERRFENERVRCEGLSTEEGCIVGYWRFKALRVDAPVWVLALFCTCVSVSDAGDVSQCVSELAAEDVSFIGWHPQWFLDGIIEAVSRELEVLEHSEKGAAAKDSR